MDRMADDKNIELLQRWCVEKCTTECNHTPGVDKECESCTVVAVSRLLDLVGRQRVEIKKLEEEKDELRDEFMKYKILRPYYEQ